MGCKAPRKGPRRPPRRREIADPDLRDLANGIAECQLDRNSRSWFALPWRDPWNAVALAAELAQLDPDGLADLDGDAIAFVKVAIAARATDSETYWRADELLRMTQGAPLVSAALRCLQIVMSKSDGGGEVPSVILRVAYDRACAEGAFEDSIAEHRCRDAIGTTRELRGDRHDRLRRAFLIAWSRGLFRAIYALPHVDDEGAKA
jgi:hypothetical protein